MDRKQTIEVTTSKGVVKVNFHDTSKTSGRIECVSLSQDSTEFVYEETYITPQFTGVQTSSVDIWRHYEAIHRGNLVIRSGFGLCGCYEDYHPGAAPNPRRPESDTEHASGCVELIRGLQAYYPDLLTPELYLRAEHLLKDHDLGENEYGDRPDDGSQNRSEKDQSELISFIRASARLPAELRATAISDFICFQDPTFPGHPPEIAMLVQLAKVIDKLEAVLSGAVYEKSGAPGDLAYKNRYYDGLTAQDRHFIHEAGDDSSVIAGWLAHATHDYHTYYGFPYVLDIVRAAVVDVRKYWFPWFNAFCRRNHIPPHHVVHPRLFI